MDRASVLAFSLILVFMVLLVLTVQVQIVEGSGTVYIKSNGTIDPSTAPIFTVDNTTYIFTSNICGSMVVERSNITVDGAGYSLEGTAEGIGMYLSYRNDVIIKNLILKDFQIGMSFQFCLNISIMNNTLSNHVDGIALWNSSHNTVSENTLTDILLTDSSHNVISRNTFRAKTPNKGSGIGLFSSSDNIIIENTIENFSRGLILKFSSSNNTIYHNYFVGNTHQVVIEVDPPATNTWDNGEEGNYWSNYLERYPEASEIDGSNVWDIPYIINKSNQDNYPLVPEFSQFLILLLFMLATLLVMIVYRRKHHIDRTHSFLA